MPSVRERQLCFLAAAFKIPKSGKQSKVSFYSLFSKQSPKPNSQLFLYLAGPLSGFNLFDAKCIAFKCAEPSLEGGKTSIHRTVDVLQSIKSQVCQLLLWMAGDVNDIPPI